MERLDVDSAVAVAALNPAEIALIADTASATGIPAAATLSRTGLSPEVLRHGKCKTSMRQHVTALKNAIGLTGDRLLALRAGSCAHLTAFGIIGYALWSSDTLGAALSVAREHAPLLNFKCGPTLSIENGAAILRFAEPIGLDIDETELTVEFELAKVVTLLRDLQVPGFQLSHVHLLSSSAEYLQRAGILLGCSNIAEDTVAQIRFDAGWLERSLSQADSRTHRACLEACSQLLEVQGNHYDLASSVRSILANAATTIPTLPEVASTLCMSARTLRRRLDLMNTSYSQLLDDVRKTLAIRYVASTGLTTEIIAERLGYSDAANFSHAFKRWTGKAPRQYRATSVDLPLHNRTRGHA
ncbi:AraC family transcriptional regulator [Burkholderia multivorans]|uniref:AraC family transcriptional regulator n=2 Tax=Burkholderia multivorans TaxID=87883 RepID=UPI002019CF2B|nr:AraC family transcriptional regulator [Burkholderia multivorans]MCO1374645.1 AraC family transcriptional regulator [Burkholderia multivorans]MCO1459787.1 AraC family transcriptional regulator [Burkholderia multivorans]MCO1463790.1 AraC family transcriptional regulator [Burkholderia multivorans]UQO21208.1 AraC family transcriptional regulator [Burkholderia multivorans]UQO87460.1 AraC family transcriptional regulator [Burkholderia multivorans]